MIPDITVAEKRMAALTRLHLNTKQKAFMPDIFPDTVYKIRQRLRKQLKLNDELATEMYLTKLSLTNVFCYHDTFPDVHLLPMKSFY